MTDIVGDWGTSRLRLYRLGADGAVAARADGPGIGEVGGRAADALRDAVRELALDGWPTRIALVGMAGARGALVEAPYAPCPAAERDWAGAAARTEVDGAEVVVGAGLACANVAGAPDVMRGEEAQVFGALRLRPELARGRHLILHPGTHAKWIEVADGQVVRFHTVVTGELFALLTERSTLLRAGGTDGGEEGGFAAGLAAARGPGRVIGSLFAARAAQLREGRSAGWAKAYLSGVLIGGEVRLALEMLGDAGPLTVIGDAALTARYAEALASDGVAHVVMDGEDCALAGLKLLGEAA